MFGSFGFVMDFDATLQTEIFLAISAVFYGNAFLTFLAGYSHFVKMFIDMLTNRTFRTAFDLAFTAVNLY